MTCVLYFYCVSLSGGEICITNLSNKELKYPFFELTQSASVSVYVLNVSCKNRRDVVKKCLGSCVGFEKRTSGSLSEAVPDSPVN